VHPPEIREVRRDFEVAVARLGTLQQPLHGGIVLRLQFGVGPRFQRQPPPAPS
jgi:hypothetical protein